MKFCSFCGNEYDETVGLCPDCNVKTCERCGALVKAEAITCYNCNKSFIKTPEEIKEEKDSRRGLGVLSALLFGLFGLFFLLVFPHNSTQRRTFMEAWNVTTSIQILVVGIIPIVGVLVYVLVKALMLSA